MSAPPASGARVRAVSGASIAMMWTDDVLIVDNTSAVASIQLPNVTALPYSLWVFPRWIYLKASTATNAVTLLRYGSEKIENVAATYSLTGGIGGTLITTDLTDWYVLAKPA